MPSARRVAFGLVHTRERGPSVGGAPPAAIRARERARRSLDRRFAARRSALPRARRWPENDGRYQARGSVLRRLILGQSQIRAPGRALAAQSVVSAPSRDQPSTKERFGRSQPARRAKPEASAREKKVEYPPHLRARWPARRPRTLSGHEESPQRDLGRGNPHIARSRRKQKNQPTPNAGKPSRAGGATSPRRQWTSSRGSNLKGMDDGATARTVLPLEPRPQMWEKSSTGSSGSSTPSRSSAMGALAWSSERRSWKQEPSWP